MCLMVQLGRELECKNVGGTEKEVMWLGDENTRGGCKRTEANKVEGTQCG